jgi:hypothetical protein
MSAPAAASQVHEAELSSTCRAESVPAETTSEPTERRCAFVAGRFFWLRTAPAAP